MQSDRYDLYQSGGILAPPISLDTTLIEIYLTPSCRITVPYNG